MYSDLERIVGVLDDVEGAPEIMAGLLSRWITHTRERLSTQLSSQDQTHEVREFVSLYQQLDGPGKVRFLASPCVSEYLEEPEARAYEGLHRGSDSVLTYMVEELRKECAIGFIRAGLPLPNSFGTTARFKSPLGDVSARHHQGAGGWQLEGADTIGNGAIAIDFDSPLSARYEPESGTFSQPRFDHTATEQALVIEKLGRALELIEAAVPIYGLMIKTFTRRIIVRKTEDPSEPQRPGGVTLASEFRPVHSGCIRLLNVHHDDMSVVLCMEALVHETIHSYLSCYEDLSGKFMSTRVVVRPMSPWSGNLIPNHSLAHAIFVYYGIYRLFLRSLSMRNRFAPAELAQVERRLADVTAGFLIDPPLSSLFFLDNPASAGFDEAIDRLQDVVKASLSVLPVHYATEAVA